MKSTITENISFKAISYPCLGKYKKSSFVVLFTGPRIGTVVYTNNSSISWPLGYYSDTWEMDCFEYFNGEVTLRNEN